MLTKDTISQRKTDVFKKIEAAARRGDVHHVVYAAETLKDIENQFRRIDSVRKYSIDTGFVL
jgi:hypothetical protein